MGSRRRGNQGDDTVKAKYLSIIMMICIMLSGCVMQKDTVDPIIEKAYNHLKSQEEKETIINWENATITEHDYSKEQSHQVWNMETHMEVDLKDRQAYKVVFKVNDPRLLGDIQVYVDKSTLEVLGLDLRD